MDADKVINIEKNRSPCYEDPLPVDKRVENWSEACATHAEVI